MVSYELRLLESRLSIGYRGSRGSAPVGFQNSAVGVDLRFRLRVRIR
jgi:hypothetical protein